MPEPGLGNVERLRRAFDRWNAGDRTPPLEEFHPDVEVQTVIGDAFQGEPYRGYDGVREWLGALDENFETWDLELHDVREPEPGRVVALGTIHARGRGSGLEIDQDLTWTLEMRDGLVYRMRTVFGHQAPGSS